MRALYYTGFGGADCLQLGDLPLPEVSAGEVLVKVAAAGLNPIDVKTRAGKGFVAAQLGESFCFVPGYDLAGTVETAADAFAAGTPVIGMVNFPLAERRMPEMSKGAGACAEYCAVSTDDLVAAPKRMQPVRR